MGVYSSTNCTLVLLTLQAPGQLKEALLLRQHEFSSECSRANPSLNRAGARAVEGGAAAAPHGFCCECSMANPEAMNRAGARPVEGGAAAAPHGFCL